MAWLLRNRKHEDDHAGMGRLASSENPDVYLETMEEAENESAKPLNRRVRNRTHGGVGGRSLD